MTETTTHPPGASLHLGGDAWASPDLEPLLVPIEEVLAFPGNPRRHDQDNITGSMRDLGCWAGVVCQTSTGYTLVGNGRRRALLDLGATRIPRTLMDVDDGRAAAIVARDNLTSDLSTNDNEELLALLTADPTTLELSGYDDELLAMLEQSSAADPAADADGRAPTTGEMLSLADVTYGEPKHTVHHGEVWRLGPHTLVVAKLHDEHSLWAHLLTGDHLFAPYPEPYITCSTVAAERPLLLIQPNVFLAGHLLDKHVSTHPADEVVRIVGHH